MQTELHMATINGFSTSSFLKIFNFCYIIFSLELTAMDSEQNPSNNLLNTVPSIELTLKHDRVIPISYKIGLMIPSIKEKLDIQKDATLRFNINCDASAVNNFLELLKTQSPHNFVNLPTDENLSEWDRIGIRDKALDTALRTMPLPTLLEIKDCIARAFKIPPFSPCMNALTKIITEKASMLSESQKDELTNQYSLSSIPLNGFTPDVKVVYIRSKDGTWIAMPYYIAKLSIFLSDLIETFDGEGDIEVEYMDNFDKDVIKQCIKDLMIAEKIAREKYFYKSIDEFDIKTIQFTIPTNIEQLVDMIQFFDFLNITIPEQYYGDYGYKLNEYTQKIQSYNFWKENTKTVLQQILTQLYNTIHIEIVHLLVDVDTPEEQKKHIEYIKTHWSADMIRYFKDVCSSMSDQKYVQYIQNNFFTPSWFSYFKNSLQALYADYSKKISDYKAELIFGSIATTIGLTTAYKFMKNKINTTQ